MADASTRPIPLDGYHAHVYFDAAMLPVAERLAEAK
jgi:aromatic ring-cleaving dioxygenase